MGNPNPYKDIEIPFLIREALDAGDRETVEKALRFWIHSKRKFEKAYQREYVRNVKLRIRLGYHIRRRGPNKERAGNHEKAQ